MGHQRKKYPGGAGTAQKRQERLARQPVQERSQFRPVPGLDPVRFGVLPQVEEELEDGHGNVPRAASAEFQRSCNGLPQVVSVVVDGGARHESERRLPSLGIGMSTKGPEGVESLGCGVLSSEQRFSISVQLFPGIRFGAHEVSFRG